jgi:dihydroorotate dehydrogenase (NAD+) catalytic subunit
MITTKPFLYDVESTYEQNCEKGPQFQGTIFRVFPPKEQWIDFLGILVASRVGIPAGPLLNSKWTKLAFQTGADICVYKTIRAKPQEVNGFPNVRFLQASEMFDPDKPPKVLYALESPPEDRSEIAITNSFGMPSKGEEYLQEDIPAAMAQAKEGQVLVVSVVGTDTPSFVAAALLAKRCGAKIIEANFSCPNVCGKEGQLYLDPEQVESVGGALVGALNGIPLIIKVGRFDSKERMAETFIAAHKVGVAAISGINTVAVEVKNLNGTPALDEKRKISGVCGTPILKTALAFAKMAKEIIKEKDLKLILIAGGGITKKEHIDQFLQHADFVMCATGWYNDPEIFLRS